MPLIRRHTREIGGVSAVPALVVAITASVCLVISAPFIGQARSGLQALLPGQFRVVVAGATAAILGLAIVTAITRIRHRRALRYGALLIAVGGGVLYAFLTRTGNAAVDAVERVHFIEYGLLTVVYYRVWRARGDLTTFAYPAIASLMTAAGDEWLQWFIPDRVGELRDIFLNAAAIACGLLFSVALAPPPRLDFRIESRARPAVAAVVGAAALTLAVFVHVIHLGYDVQTSDGATFRSRFAPTALAAEAQTRLEVWRDRPPLSFARLSREDQYLSEGLWHVQRRNARWEAGDVFSAWHENRILEDYFAPVLDTPSYRAPISRWPADQRSDAQARATGDVNGYLSDAHPFPLYAVDRRLYWFGVLVSTAGLAWLCLRLPRIPEDGSAPATGAVPRRAGV